MCLSGWNHVFLTALAEMLDSWKLSYAAQFFLPLAALEEMMVATFGRVGGVRGEGQQHNRGPHGPAEEMWE